MKILRNIGICVGFIVYQTLLGFGLSALTALILGIGISSVLVFFSVMFVVILVLAYKGWDGLFEWMEDN